MQRDDQFNEYDNPYAAPLSSFENAPYQELQGDIYGQDDLRPFQTIWLHPRKTVRSIVAFNPEMHVLLLVCLAGIGEALDRASNKNAGDSMPLGAIFALAFVLGPLSGLIGLWIGSYLIRISGEWLGGNAPREHIKTAMAWSSVPAVFALPLWIPQLLLIGEEMFTTNTPRLDAQPALLIPFLGIALVELVLGIWGFVLLCNTVAEVQGFRSAWRGFGNLILAGLIVFVPLMIVVAGLVFLAGSL